MMRINNFLLVLPITSILLFIGEGVVCLFGDPSKTGESIESLFDRSDEIGSKFHKAYQPSEQFYQNLILLLISRIYLLCNDQMKLLFEL